MDDINKQEVIDEYEAKKSYFDGLRDEISNLEKSIVDARNKIKCTIDSQERLKTENYRIWSNLEVKDIQPKTTEKQPDISDILNAFK